MHKIPCCIFFILLGTGTLSAQAEKTKKNAPQPTLAQQKLCSDQAEKVFKKWLSPDSGASSFQSRYEPSQSICYVEMDESEPPPRGLSFVIMDAFGKATYGRYLDRVRKSKGNGPDEETPVICSVKPPDQSKLSCSSVFEFQDLVEKYFGMDLGL